MKLEGKIVVCTGQANQDLMGDVKIVSGMIGDLISTLGMRGLGEPLVADVPLEIRKLGLVPWEDEGGVSCCAMLSTSHIAFHGWPLRRVFSLMVYSCRDFDTYEIERCLSNRIRAKMLNVNDVTPSLELYAPHRSTLQRLGREVGRLAHAIWQY